MSDNNANLSSTERIKQSSDNLRGSLVESLENEITGNFYEDDVALVRFHGMYVQDDRDRRDERAARKLERLYSFMIRLHCAKQPIVQVLINLLSGVTGS